MSATKSTTLTLRIDPDLKEALRNAADQQHRSVTNMVEVLIRDYCQQQRISIGVAASSNQSTDRNSINAQLPGMPG